jgi:predicted DNA-binding antitoxin AbrB/MazE fold protein
MRFFARYKNGALHPEDALNLPDGTDVEVILRLRK